MCEQVYNCCTMHTHGYIVHIKYTQDLYTNHHYYSMDIYNYSFAQNSSNHICTYTQIHRQPVPTFRITTHKRCRSKTWPQDRLKTQMKTQGFEWPNAMLINGQQFGDLKDLQLICFWRLVTWLRPVLKDLKLDLIFAVIKLISIDLRLKLPRRTQDLIWTCHKELVTKRLEASLGLVSNDLRLTFSLSWRTWDLKFVSKYLRLDLTLPQITWDFFWHEGHEFNLEELETWC